MIFCVVSEVEKSLVSGGLEGEHDKVQAGRREPADSRHLNGLHNTLAVDIVLVRM